MSKQITVSIRDDQYEFLKKHKKYQPSGVIQDALDHIMKQEELVETYKNMPDDNKKGD